MSSSFGTGKLTNGRFSTDSFQSRFSDKYNVKDRFERNYSSRWGLNEAADIDLVPDSEEAVDDYTGYEESTGSDTVPDYSDDPTVLSFTSTVDTLFTKEWFDNLKAHEVVGSDHANYAEFLNGRIANAYYQEEFGAVGSTEAKARAAAIIQHYEDYGVSDTTGTFNYDYYYDPDREEVYDQSYANSLLSEKERSENQPYEEVKKYVRSEYTKDNDFSIDDVNEWFNSVYGFSGSSLDYYTSFNEWNKNSENASGTVNGFIIKGRKVKNYLKDNRDLIEDFDTIIKNVDKYLDYLTAIQKDIDAKNSIYTDILQEQKHDVTTGVGYYDGNGVYHNTSVSDLQDNIDAVTSKMETENDPTMIEMYNSEKMQYQSAIDTQMFSLVGYVGYDGKYYFNSYTDIYQLRVLYEKQLPYARFEGNDAEVSDLQYKINWIKNIQYTHFNDMTYSQEDVDTIANEAEEYMNEWSQKQAKLVEKGSNGEITLEEYEEELDQLDKDYDAAKTRKDLAAYGLDYYESQQNYEALDDEERALVDQIVSSKPDGFVYDPTLSIYGMDYMDQLKSYKDGLQHQLSVLMGSEETADNIVEDAGTIQNRKDAITKAAEDARFAEEHPGWASAASVLSQLLSAPTAILESAKPYLPEWLGGYVDSGKPIDIYSPSFDLVRSTNTIRGTVAENIDNPLGRAIYTFGMSTADQAVSLAVTGAVGKVLGLSGEALKGVMRIGSLTILGSNVAASGIYEGIQLGYSDEKALLYGLSKSAIEVITETIGVEAELNGIFSNRGALSAILEAGAAEAKEEWLSNQMNRMAEEVLISGNTAIDRKYNEYINSGLTEQSAAVHTLTDLLSEDVTSAIGGFFGGILFSGGVEAYKSISFSDIGETSILSDTVPDLMEYAADNNLSQLVQGATQNLSNTQAGYLTTQVKNNIVERMEQVTTKADLSSILIEAEKLGLPERFPEIGEQYANSLNELDKASKLSDEFNQYIQEKEGLKANQYSTIVTDSTNSVQSSSSLDMDELYDQYSQAVDEYTRSIKTKNNLVKRMNSAATKTELDEALLEAEDMGLREVYPEISDTYSSRLSEIADSAKTRLTDETKPLAAENVKKVEITKDGDTILYTKDGSVVNAKLVQLPNGLTPEVLTSAYKAGADGKSAQATAAELGIPVVGLVETAYNQGVEVSTAAGYGTGGAGDSLKFNSWDDFKGYIQDIGKSSSLTNAEKIQKIQKAYDGIADKSDINIPISDKYVKGFNTDGTVIYDWPKYLGFDKKTITSISRSNLLPETWDRYGSMKGSNFADVPSSGKYSNSERSIPYVENEKAYHYGRFNNDTYFDKIDAIKSGDLNGLNEILRSEGVLSVSNSYFEELMDAYRDFIEDAKDSLGTKIDATYGLKGKVASWGDLKGGAGQIVTPLIGKMLSRLGIIY